MLNMAIDGFHLHALFNAASLCVLTTLEIGVGLCCGVFGTHV